MKILVSVTFASVISFLVFKAGQGTPLDPQISKDVEDFLNKEISKPQEADKRSDYSGNIELLPAHTSSFGEVTEPSRKPEKISVTIFKEYKVKQPGGEYISIQEQDGDFQGKMNPPQVQEFIEHETGSFGSEMREIPTSQPIVHAERQEEAYQNQEIPEGNNAYNFDKTQEFQNTQMYSPTPKRKSMDGWIPLYGQRQIGHFSRGSVTDLYKKLSKSHLTKGNYSPEKEGSNQNSLDIAASGFVPQIVPYIQQAQAQTFIPQIVQPSFTHQQQTFSTPQQMQIIPIVQPQSQYFAQNEVIPQQNKEQQFQNLVIDNNKQQRSPVFQGVSGLPNNFVIHAQNVIIGSQNQSQSGDSSQIQQGSPNVRQIQAYGSTPQITSLLRERFRLTKAPSDLRSGSIFPPGGLPLQSLAQALRNGAFSLENDVIPSSDASRQQEMQIMIPHSFKIRNPTTQSRYSPAGNQLATAASIEQPIAYGQQSLGGSYAPPPRLSLSNKGQIDYGDSVKYTAPIGYQPEIDIVKTQHAGDYSQVNLAPAALELKNKLVKMVMQELNSQYGLPGGSPGTPLGEYGTPPQSQYGAPPQSQYGAPLQSQYGAPPQSQYGAPPQSQYGAPPQSQYGLPGGSPGTPLGEYGPPPQSQYGPSSSEYGAPSDHGKPLEEIEIESDNHYDSYHLSPPAIPTTLALDFDFGAGQGPKGGKGHSHSSHGEGYEEYSSHGSYGDEGLSDAHGHDQGPDTKQQLAKLGKSLFWAALDFSRKYNPVTFIEKVKEFPPIRFEIHDKPKSHGHGGKGKKRRSQKA